MEVDEKDKTIKYLKNVLKGQDNQVFEECLKQKEKFLDKFQEFHPPLVSDKNEDKNQQ